MKKWRIIILVLVIALFVAWYAFRPERLVVNQRVQEEFPAAHGDSVQKLASGAFHDAPRGRQLFTALRTAVAFCASRTSRPQTVLTFMST